MLLQRREKCAVAEKEEEKLLSMRRRKNKGETGIAEEKKRFAWFLR